jgi:molecular chaperone DnaK
VSFDVDSNGVLKVTAKDQSTGKEQSIRIEASSGLSTEDIEKMKQDAEAHATEDEKKKKLVEVRNLADQTIYTAEKSLRDHGDKVPAEVKTSVEDKIKALQEVKGVDDVAAIETKLQELSTELSKIGESLQKDQPAAEPTPEKPAEGGDGESEVK